MAHPAPHDPHASDPHKLDAHAHDPHRPGAPTHADGHHHGHVHGNGNSHDHDHGPGHEDGLAEMLDLDAVVFAPYLAAVTGRLADLAGDAVTHVVDLGAGTGTGTFALLERFPAARVTAVDTSPAMLDRLTAAARARGLGDRVRTLEADAGAGLPGITGADLVWASASLHHLDDPAAGLGRIRAALRPGGLLAVVEMDGLPHFLPDGGPAAGGPGLEARCREALSVVHAEQVPHLGADWGALLAAAGLPVEAERAEHLEVRAPLPAGAGLYAYRVLDRIRGAVRDRVGPADLDALGALLDGGPQDVRHRDDLVVRSTRTLWAARRPADGS
ncbi:SAM-dependent methyltransferase [Kitasatospora sp. NE20-6]|uniref:class I SAM-dependent methyltransferase n=1 Tax=Kitasatospora sp. NE20-6 TaxID=2859066 RepID=UPI0034DC772E